MSTYLVTGAMGCIGAWTLHHLVKQGKSAISFDLSENRYRLDLLLTPEEQQNITFVQGDLTDTDSVRAVFADHGITHVVHLAALQVPFCRANPPLGAQVNVTGTVNVFEAAKATGVSHITQASSIAVYGPPELYDTELLPHNAPMLPRTLYGVYKVADEGLANVYWHDHGITSTTLRPYTVYGPARDQGMTSEPTKAMQAAANGEDYHISFGGKMQFHYASDVAQQFIEAAENPHEGAVGYNLGTDPVAVQTVADLIMENAPGTTVTVGETILPFPIGFESNVLPDVFDNVYETPLADAVKATMDHFRAQNG
ncbi:MAG: NAD(P)-dependent oxidoreductase [Chloroflexota bacterium]